MLYKRISFRTPVPVDVDWGDGNPVHYDAGIVAGWPTGEVIVTSTEPVETIEFLEDTISKVAFDEAPDFRDAAELFKDKHNIQVVYFDKNSPLITVREAFMDSGVFYYSDLYYNTPIYLQYLNFNANRLECIDGLNTTKAINAYDMFRNTPNLRHPRQFEIDKLEDTDNGGCAWWNTFQCIHPVYHDDVNYNESNIPTKFPTSFEAPTDYWIKLTWADTINRDSPSQHQSLGNGNAHVDTTNKYLVLDGVGDWVGTTCVMDKDYGSVCVWIYRRQDGRDYDTPFCDSNGSRMHCWIPSDNKLYFQLDGSQKGRCSSSVTIPANTWTHIAVTYSPTQVKLFINGDEVGGTDNVVFEGGFWQSDRDWLYFGGSSYVTDFYGYMRKGIVFNRTLHPEEVKAIYLEGM